MHHDTQANEPTRRESEIREEAQVIARKLGEGQGDAVAEEWRPVVGYEGRYEVSNIGRVRALMCIHNHVNKVRETPLVLSLIAHEQVYPRVALATGVNRRRKLHYVHTLVAAAFIGACHAGMEIAHLNGVRADCQADNLGYVTRSENHAHKKVHGTQVYGPIRAKLASQQVLAIRGRIGAGERMNHLAVEYGVARCTLTKITHRQTWKHL